jgi:hypothetical protein
MCFIFTHKTLETSLTGNNIIMKSILLILNKNRIYYTLFLFFIACISFFSSQISDKPNTLEFIDACFAICLIIAILSGEPVNRKLRKFFPVPDNVLAWNPIAFLVMFFITFSIFFILGLIIKRFEIRESFFHFIYALPLYFLYGLIVLRLLAKYFYNRSPYLLLIPIFPIVLYKANIYIRMHNSFIIALPIVLCIFFLYERPYLFRKTPRKFITDEDNLKPPVAVCIGDTIFHLFGLSFILQIIIECFRISQIWKILTVIFSLIVLSQLWKTQYILSRASGFSRKKSIICGFLSACFFIPPPLEYIGLKHGNTVKCKNCKEPMFHWQFKCPHCYDETAFIDNNFQKEIKNSPANTFSILDPYGKERTNNPGEMLSIQMFCWLIPFMILLVLIPSFASIELPKNVMIKQEFVIIRSDENSTKTKPDHAIIEKAFRKQDIEEIIKKSIHPRKYIEYSDKIYISIIGKINKDKLIITFKYPDYINSSIFSELVKKSLNRNKDMSWEIQTKTERIKPKLFQRLRSGKRYLKFK